MQELYLEKTNQEKKLKKLKLRRKLKKCVKKISIKIRRNNIFCTYTNLKTRKILYTVSAGKCNIPITRPKLRYGSIAVLSLFFARIKKFLRKSYIILELSLPKSYKKRILRKVRKFLRRKKIYVFYNPKKCFNGCKAKKLRRTGKYKNIKLYQV